MEDKSPRHSKDGRGHLRKDFDEAIYIIEGKQTGEVSCLTVKASRM